jgi:hypothetical protein
MDFLASHTRLRAPALIATIALGTLTLTACGGDDGPTAAVAAPGTGGTPGTGAGTVTEPSPSTGGPSTTANTAPKIAGTPATSAVQGQAYSFKPTATDAENDSLVFSATGVPAWAKFDSATGLVEGTPAAGDVGSTATITIEVSDGKASAQLAAFQVRVEATAAASVTLTWTPPTSNVDGSPLTDLKGYKIYWGTVEGEYANSVTIENPGLTSYVVEQLTPATWYFVATAVNAQGVESGESNVAQKQVL